MDMSKESTSDSGKLSTWLILGGVFVAAMAVTIAIGTRGSSTETTFPDLGDIAAQDPNLPSTAEPAPTFVLPTLDGGTFDLADHISTDGRPVVLNLWASWCGPCRAEMPAINQSATEHPEVAYVGVSVKDDVGDATAFAGELGISYTIAFDDGTVDEAYPVLGLPATFFINGDGVLLETHFGAVTVDSLDEEIAALFGS
jgi:cytochrome c biogenesis protein CcmG, thiol:disulfide interchange protein DsbE